DGKLLQLGDNGKLLVQGTSEEVLEGGGREQAQSGPSRTTAQSSSASASTIGSSAEATPLNPNPSLGGTVAGRVPVVALGGVQPDEASLQQALRWRPTRPTLSVYERFSGGGGGRAASGAPAKVPVVGTDTAGAGSRGDIRSSYPALPLPVAGRGAEAAVASPSSSASDFVRRINKSGGAESSHSTDRLEPCSPGVGAGDRRRGRGDKPPGDNGSDDASPSPSPSPSPKEDVHAKREARARLSQAAGPMCVPLTTADSGPSAAGLGPGAASAPSHSEGSSRQAKGLGPLEQGNLVGVGCAGAAKQGRPDGCEKEESERGHPSTDGKRGSSRKDHVNGPRRMTEGYTGRSAEVETSAASLPGAVAGAGSTPMEESGEEEGGQAARTSVAAPEDSRPEPEPVPGWGHRRLVGGGASGLEDGDGRARLGAVPEGAQACEARRRGRGCEHCAGARGEACLNAVTLPPHLAFFGSFLASRLLLVCLLVCLGGGWRRGRGY
ncbi:unnamed protein product, partial [Discosporangium mesarthrocarpum]